MDISVVIPCLNESETLQICIDKIKKKLSERKLQGEIIISDNGSTDGSLDIAKKNDVKIINVEKKGYGFTVSSGINSAKGKYILIADADDSYDFNELPNFYDEIDKNKARQDGAGFNARYVIRILDVYRTKGSLFKGVSLGEGKGKLFVQHYETEGLPHDFDLSVPDNQIIATALTEKAKYKRKKVIVVSQDINMRVKCDSLGLLCEDYVAHDTVENKDEVFTGLSKYLVDEQVVDSFYAGEDIFADKEEIKLQPNQYVMLVSNSNDKKTALARSSNVRATPVPTLKIPETFVVFESHRAASTQSPTHTKSRFWPPSG